MDALLLALQNVSEQLLPILGAVALIFLCIFIKRLIKMVEELTLRIKDLNPTIKLVDQSIEKMQAPLDTVVKYSNTLDKVHDKTNEAFGKVSDFVSDSVSKITDSIKEEEGE